MKRSSYADWLVLLFFEKQNTYVTLFANSKLVHPLTSSIIKDTWNSFVRSAYPQLHVTFAVPTAVMLNFEPVLRRKLLPIAKKLIQERLRININPSRVEPPQLHVPINLVKLRQEWNKESIYQP